MGGFDIFKSELENGEWSTPINMGYPINTTCDDFHFVTNARGSRGYYSSSQTGGLGEQDIYSVELESSEAPILLVRGNIRTEGVEIAEAAPKITIIDKTTHKAANTVYEPNKASGKYLITLPPAKEYDMIVEAEGFKPYQTSVVMPKMDEFHEVYQIITLRSLGDGEGQEIVVQNIFADTRESINGDTSLISTANLNNRDYLETLTQNLNENADNEVAINQAMSLTDHISNQIIGNEETYAETNSSKYVFDENDPNKGLKEYLVGDHTVLVIPDNYEEQETIGQEVADNSDNETESSDNNSNNSNEDASTDPNTEGEHTAAFTFEVKFGFDKFELSESYLNDVEIIYSTYKRHEEAYIEIDGHTDSKGSDIYNMSLSKRRADAVAEYLIKKGVPKSHISTSGKGETQPIAPNTKPDGTDNPEGRAKNRRTEVKIVNH
ncbi:OmpA family protein [Flavobacteriales bacterium]|nr:OmpA family protein [Flavobacteriales bacterium]